MSRMLASVTDIDEALIAVECGVDIIDLKNPLEGALGALPVDAIRDIVQAVAGRAPTSATVGDLPMQPEVILDAVKQTADTGVDIVKVGFFGHVGHDQCLTALSAVTRDIRIVAVLFADQSPNLDLVVNLSRAGFHGVMLDTAAKNGKRLCHYLDADVLESFVHESKLHGLLTGLAGSLAIDDLSGLLPLGADYLGFRGALCGGANRMARLERARLSHLLNVLHSCNTVPEELVG